MDVVRPDELGEEVAVVEKESFDPAVENDDLDPLVRFDGRHEVAKLKKLDLDLTTHGGRLVQAMLVLARLALAQASAVATHAPAVS